MPYSDSDLEELLSTIEADFAERKETWSGDASEKGRQAICAFANDLPDHRREGVLFVGVNDKGIPTGLDVSDQLLQTLASIKTDGKILPPPSITVEKRSLLGVEVAVVHVRPSDSPPVKYDGRVWIRIGPRRAVATVQEERILIEKNRSANRPFDIHPCVGTTIEDLDVRFFLEEYLVSAIARNILDENGRTQEQQLASVKFIVSPTEERPTNLAVLVAGKTTIDHIPGAYVQFTRFNGVSLTDDIVDESAIDGRLDEVVTRVEEKFVAHNSVSVDLTSEAKEIRRKTYPLVAFQQLFRNALMHRVYEYTNSPIRIYWFADRLEILNPGGPFGVVTTDTFGNPGVTDYRNPNIAEAMKNLGYAQRFGVGIAMARKALRENGNADLNFELNQSFTLATMRP